MRYAMNASCYGKQQKKYEYLIRVHRSKIFSIRSHVQYAYKNDCSTKYVDIHGKIVIHSIRETMFSMIQSCYTVS